MRRLRHWIAAIRYATYWERAFDAAAKGKRRKALLLIQKAITAIGLNHPKVIEPLCLKGYLHHKLGEHEAALETFRQVLALQTRPKKYTEHDWNYMRNYAICYGISCEVALGAKKISLPRPIPDQSWVDKVSQNLRDDFKYGRVDKERNLKLGEDLKDTKQERFS